MPHQNFQNDPAVRIAASNASSLRVLAGPGTGKTHALKLRVARLLSEGVSPKMIFATTFTRTAAWDLQLALARMNVLGASSVQSTTIHSRCFSILSKESVLKFSGRAPRPLLEFEKHFLIEDLREAGVGKTKVLTQLLKDFAAAWARDQKDRPGWPSRPLDRKFERHLLSWLEFHESMLIEELVPEALRYLRANPESSERNAYSHVLVDEYQDLNVVEQEFVRLVSEDAMITIIGDEDQSIYDFKHAHPEGISEFHIRNPETIDETLSVCWRCPENIVDIANRLISRNQSRSNRVLYANNEFPEADIDVVQWNTMEEEAIGIAQFTKRIIQDCVIEPGRILILAPRKEIGYEVRDALNSLEVSAHSFFKEQELDENPKKISESRIQQAFTLLQLIAKPEDHVALRSWCGFGSPSLRSGAWSRIQNMCLSTDKSLPKVLDGIASGDLKLDNDYKSEFFQRLSELQIKRGEVSELKGQILFDELFPQNDPYFRHVRDAVSEEMDQDEDAQTLLERLRKNITQPELPTDVDYVRIMSLHKSKGLTADLVIVLGCIQGLIPSLSKPSITNEEKRRKYEEQRRLFYVAITRTRKHLVLSSFKNLPAYEAYKMNYNFVVRRRYVPSMTSRFIDELGPCCPQAVTGQEFLEKYNM